jgi:hypothetical protein
MFFATLHNFFTETPLFVMIPHVFTREKSQKALCYCKTRC